MGKKKVIEYRTEKARELHEQYLDKLNEYENAKEKMHQIFMEYLKMEGKYGEKVSDSWDCGQGCRRGYHYEYKNSAVRKKEEKERKDFLIANNYTCPDDLYEQYHLDDLLQDYYMEQYGMTIEQKDFADAIESTKRYIRKLQHEIEENKQWIKEITEELNNMCQKTGE